MEIMLVAQVLFNELGYTKTSVETIIQKANIAKGTFYYYFKSKQDILRSLVEHTSEQMQTLLHAIVADKNVSAIEKLQRMLQGPQKQALVDTPIMQIIHKPENRELQEQLNIESVERIAPLFTTVFKQGYEEGVFTQQVGLETVQLIFAGSAFVLESGIFNWPAKKHRLFFEALQNLLEKITGAKIGTFSFILTLSK